LNAQRTSLVFYLLLVAVAVYGLFFLIDRETNLEKHRQMESILSELNKQDVAIGRDVLKLRASILSHFDTLASSAQQINNLIVDLEAGLQTVYKTGNSEIAILFSAYREILDEKLITLELIKRNHAITLNSLHYLPMAVERLQRVAQGELKTESGKLLQQILLFNTSPSAQRKGDVEQMVKQLRSSQHPKAQRALLNNVLIHVTLFIRERDKLEGYLETFFNNPAPKHLAVLQSRYSTLRYLETSRLSLIVQGLFALSMVLLAGVGGSLLALRMSNRRILAEVEHQKDTETDLRTNEEKFRSVTMSANDAIISANTDGNITSWNRAAEHMFGFAEETILGQPVAVLIPEKFKQAHLVGIDRFRRTGKSNNIGKTIELTALRQSGDEFPVEMSLSSWAIGKKRSFSAVIRDITERKKIEDELYAAKEASELANRAKSSFLAHMSHEIRTPIGTIIGIVELLHESELKPKQQQFVEILNRAGTGLLSLINDVLDLSKIEADQLLLEESPFDLLELMDDCISVLRIQAHDSGLELYHEGLQGVERFVVGDAQRLRQILLNLLGNAIKFTEQGRIVLKVARSEENELFFQVSDTGLGISAEKQATIFAPFIQVDSSTTRRYGGTGLGLAICNRLVGHMRGKIWLKSSLGEGSTFCFTARLPPASVQTETYSSPATETSKAMAEAKVDLKNLSVLVVDDAEENLLVYTSYLTKAVRKVVTAINGAEAVDKFKAGRYDVVLMDIQMPIMDGYVATGRIRQFEKDSNTPPAKIIALTAHAFKEDTRKTKAAGCDLHLSKPVTEVSAKFNPSKSHYHT
jgi:PAS domain S-box-containing protein